MEGNYNAHVALFCEYLIIPLREMEGNYNSIIAFVLSIYNYTLERDGRELQLT